MSLTVILLWAIGVTSVTLVGSLYVRRYDRPDLLIALYVAFVLTAQMLATKIASFDLGFAHFSGPAGVLVFSVTFLLLDIMNERFGRKETQHMIFLAFVAQVAMAFFLWLGTQFTPDPFWASNSDSWNKFFGLVPRITLASWIAFLISENVDAYVFAWFKKLTHDKHLLMRNAFSYSRARARQPDFCSARILRRSRISGHCGDQGPDCDEMDCRDYFRAVHVFESRNHYARKRGGRV